MLTQKSGHAPLIAEELAYGRFCLRMFTQVLVLGSLLHRCVAEPAESYHVRNRLHSPNNPGEPHGRQFGERHPFYHMLAVAAGAVLSLLCRFGSNAASISTVTIVLLYCTAPSP